MYRTSLTVLEEESIKKEMERGYKEKENYFTKNIRLEFEKYIN